MSQFTSFLNKLGIGRPKRGRAVSIIPIAEFRDALIERVRRLDPQIEIEVIDDQSYRAVHPNGDSFDATVENLYALYVDDPNLSFWADKYAASAAQDLSELEPTLENIVFVARHYETFAGQGEHLVRPFAGDIGLVLASDSPASLAFLTQGGLKDLGITSEEAFEIASRNLRNRVGPLSFDHLSARINWVNAESGLATGALALSDLWGEQLLKRLVLVETRASFLWVDGFDASAVNELRLYARKRMQSFDTLSKTLIEFDNGEWRDAGL